MTPYRGRAGRNQSLEPINVMPRSIGRLDALAALPSIEKSASKLLHQRSIVRPKAKMATLLATSPDVYGTKGSRNAPIISFHNRGGKPDRRKKVLLPDLRGTTLKKTGAEELLERLKGPKVRVIGADPFLEEQ